MEIELVVVFKNIYFWMRKYLNVCYFLYKSTFTFFLQNLNNLFTFHNSCRQILKDANIMSYTYRDNIYMNNEY